MLEVEEFVKSQVLEDIGRGDLFSKLCDDIEVCAVVIAKEDGIFSGKKYVEALTKLFNIECDFKVLDGEAFLNKDHLVSFKGSYLSILQIERTLLNILQHSSGIATNTSSYVKILRDANLDTILLDTRKTSPHLRVFEKYSVLNGGARNHRLGLDDCLMLKDTHLSKISNLCDFITLARKKIPFTSKIEVEVNDFTFAKEAIEAGCDILMCDNMILDDIKKVVDYRNSLNSMVLIEASGNITKDNLISFAKTGVDAISSGALIHKSGWIDLSLKIL